MFIDLEKALTLPLLWLALAGLVQAQPAAGQEPGARPPGDVQRVIGLLSLPEVLGEGPCDRFVPGEVRLRQAPDTGRVVGWVRVDRHWTHHDVGGCEGLVVNVHDARTGTVSALPTREYGYEEPGAIVVGARDGWFEVRLEEGTAWARPSEAATFFPLEHLLAEGLTFLTEAWDGRLAASPDPDAAPVPLDAEAARALERAHPVVRVLDSQRASEGDLYVEIELLSHSWCDADAVEEPRAVARGWVAAHARETEPAGEPAVWFYSRGC